MNFFIIQNGLIYFLIYFLLHLVNYYKKSVLNNENFLKLNSHNNIFKLGVFLFFKKGV